MFKSKPDVRSLMKKAKQDRKPGAPSQIKDKLAKYTASGQLTCILCKTPVKSDAVWPAHVRSRTHSENISALKKKSQAKAQAHTSSIQKTTSITPPERIANPAKAVTNDSRIDKESSNNRDGHHISQASPATTTHAAGFAMPLPVSRPKALIKSNEPVKEIDSGGFAVPTPVVKDAGFAIPAPVHRNMQSSGDAGTFKRPFAKVVGSSAANINTGLVSVESDRKKQKLEEFQGSRADDDNDEATNDIRSQLPSDFFDASVDESKQSAEQRGKPSEESATHNLDDYKVKAPMDGLPADFFDEPGNENEEDEVMAEADPEQVEDKSAQSESALPEGFFDDTNRDAKERNVDTRREAINEWDSFQKVMTKEQEKSEALIEEDELEYAEGRDKVLGQEQRAALERVERMKRMREQTLEKIKSKHAATSIPGNENAMKIDAGSDSDSDDDDDDIDELGDWRSKAF